MSNKPDLTNRRVRAQIKPAPDEHVDPIEPPAAVQPTPARQSAAAAAKSNAAQGVRDLNLQVSDEVGEILDFVKFKTKLTKRAAVEQAVLAHWSEYRQEK
ncbi:hypothetical protein [Arthrobacter sp. H16F315]|uniref:hypothetical protein n=1 Tax=Arthrobacter sp. H16F315 TaxID=2955314 RepID=UPI0020974EDF|nr:hypothetical protein [Arthrobacter sp. H16F315]MDD1478508.1 hypothetical protein [Arthrobacter sp. H16F315]